MQTINFGFWKMVVENAAAEHRPILTLAPMADVTDAAFRRIIAKYSRMGKSGGGPDVLWTEFVSADGLCSRGREVLLHNLAFTKAERPIVAQLFSSHPDKMREAAALVASLGFDGLDINMGCPDRSIEKQNAGAAMMKDPENAIAVLMAAREGVEDAAETLELSEGRGLFERAEIACVGGVRKLRPAVDTAAISRSELRSGWVPDRKTFCDGTPSKRCTGPVGTRRPRKVAKVVAASTSIPVSIKTRIGYNKVDLDWIRILLEQKLPVLIIHLRTRKEMSDVPAHWELMPEIIRLRDEISLETLIIGNGDVISIEDAYEKATKCGCDGIMFGRAIFGNPWCVEKVDYADP